MQLRTVLQLGSAKRHEFEACAAVADRFSQRLLGQVRQDSFLPDRGAGEMVS